MNVDDEIDRRLLRNARELRGVPIEPPPLRPASRPGVRSIVVATCAVLLAIGGGIAVVDGVRTPATDPIADGATVTTVVSPAPTSAAEPQPQSSQLLDGYDEVAMIGRAADQATAEQRPLPPGVV